MNNTIPADASVGTLEQVHAFYDAMPTGVTVSAAGRIFVCFPDWGDTLAYTVAELRNGEVAPYPDKAWNDFLQTDPTRHFISVQSVVAADKTLWILDTAAPSFSKPNPAGAKLVAFDLETDTLRKTYTFPGDVLLETTYLNDVRVDYRKGGEGVAYITDSSVSGPGAIIVLDLETGKAVRRLNGIPQVMPDPAFVPKVEGRVFMNRPADGKDTPITIGTDGIELSPDGDTLYFCPLSSRHLYSVPTKALLDDAVSSEDLARQVNDWGEKGASDGMIAGKDGVLYAGDYENNSIRAILPGGGMKTVLHDARILWPDTLSISQDNDLYFIANQLHRQAGYNSGKDLRQKPYSLFRSKLQETE